MMIPFWLLAVACGVFIIYIITENISRNRLMDEYRNIEFFLNMYISKFGNIPFEIPDALEEGGEEGGK